LYLTRFFIDIRDFDTDLLSNFEDFLRVADIAIDYLRDMDESVVLEPDIDKSTECNHIAHDTIEDIPDSYGLESEFLRAHHRGTLCAWISTDGFICAPDKIESRRCCFCIDFFEFFLML